MWSNEKSREPRDKNRNCLNVLISYVTYMKVAYMGSNRDVSKKLQPSSSSIQTASMWHQNQPSSLTFHRKGGNRTRKEATCTHVLRYMQEHSVLVFTNKATSKFHIMGSSYSSKILQRQSTLLDPPPLLSEIHFVNKRTTQPWRLTIALKLENWFKSSMIL